MTSIKDTKDEIARMEPLYGHERQGSGLGAEELQALANNHTRLVTAIEKYLAPHANDAQSKLAYEELVAAYKEAQDKDVHYINGVLVDPKTVFKPACTCGAEVSFSVMEVTWGDPLPMHWKIKCVKCGARYRAESKDE
jgi:hypothetical protein